MSRLPTYFISHGGGPWPWLTGRFRSYFDRLEASLQETAREIGHPKAVLVVSGHWEAPQFTVQSGAEPGMVYDYSGFPAETYQIRYPAPGAPEVAARVIDLLQEAGIEAAQDPNRGYDHGTFAPLKAMYPNADVPVVEMSLKHGPGGYDVDDHLAAGRALAPLRDEDVVIMGSGLSWHNLRMIGPEARESSAAFDAWLDRALAAPANERIARLKAWEQAPMARVSHPTEDHFIPLMVALGAADRETAHRVYHEENFMGGVTASSYRFG